MKNNSIGLMNKRTLFLYCGIVFSCLAFAGCASLREAGKKVWGSSIAHLEAARATGQSQVFAMRPEKVFQRAEEILKDAEAEVTLKDPARRYMAAMNFQGYVDTTQVGVFLTPQADGGTRVEVASMSPNLTEEVARILFAELKKENQDV